MYTETNKQSVDVAMLHINWLQQHNCHLRIVTHDNAQQHSIYDSNNTSAELRPKFGRRRI